MLKDRDSFIILRSGNGSYNAAGEFIETIPVSSISAIGNIQPYKEGSIKSPKLESINTFGAIKINTRNILFEASSTIKADHILFSGKQYELIIVNKWVNHYEAVGVVYNA